MSGICGMLALKGAVPDEHALIRMVDSLHHSEGERAGHRIIGQCGLGLQTHITTHENPLFVSHAAPDIPVRGSPQQAVEAWIVKDGLAFNHADIRAALTAMRHRFKTGEDTETLLRSYIQFGPENFIKPYRGQFTLAIWDETHHRLTLLRDRLGQKPIYYAITDEWVVFSSKIKSVLEHPAVG
ncbi:MAG: hypothetical protein ACFB51_15425 [Anaerolineae bacterium]